MSVSVSLKEIVKTSDAVIDTPVFITKNFSSGVKEVLNLNITNKCERKEIITFDVTHPCTRPEILDLSITYPCKIKEVITTTINSRCGIKEEIETGILTPCARQEVLSTTITAPIARQEVIQATIDTPCGVKEVLKANILTPCAVAEVLKMTVGSPCAVADVLKATILTPITQIKDVVKVEITNPCAQVEILNLYIDSPCINDGSLVISLRGAGSVVVPVTITGEGTNDLVAAKIRSTIFNGWTLSGTNNRVIFTSNTTTIKGGDNIINVSDTGVVSNAGITITQNSYFFGTVGITLRGTVFDFNANSATHYTNELVAEGMKNGTYSGWVTSRIGNVVYFTADTTGYRSGSNSINFNSTRIEGNLTLDTDSFIDTTFPVTLRGTTFNVPINSRDHATINQVASAITDFSFSGWLTPVAVNNEVTFTADDTSIRTGESYLSSSIGITGTVSIVTDSNVSANISIMLRGGTPVVIPLTATEHTTSDLVAEEIILANFSGWIATRVGSDITWTATVAEYRSGTNSFTPNGSGVTGSITVFQNSDISGDITITLRSGTPVVVPVTSILQGTVDLVAEEIRKATFTGYTTSRIGNIVYFTATTFGPKAGTNTFNPDATGVTVNTGNVEIDTVGVSSGTLGITLRGSTVYTSVSSAVETTPALVADAIVANAASFTGWNVSAVSNVVTFTASTAGYRSGTNAFLTNGTGITGSVLVTTDSLFTSNIGFSLRGVTTDVSVSSNVETTPTLVADKIRATSFASWNIGGVGANVTFTAKSAGYNGAVANSFIPYSSGVTTSGIATDVDGNFSDTLTITLRSGTPVNVSVNSVNHGNIGLVAAAIRATTFTGWDTSGTGNVVRFTANAVDVRTGTNSFTYGSSGVTSSGLTVTKDSTFTKTFDLTIRGQKRSTTVTSTTQTTAILVADKIRADNAFTGWVLSGAGTANVIFTASTEEVRYGDIAFSDANNTGVTATNVITQNGYIQENLAITMHGKPTTNIVVNSKDHYTNDLLAAKIRASAISGWLTSGTSSNVIFTANDEELRSGADSFTPTAVGDSHSPVVTASAFNNSQQSSFSSSFDISLRGGTPVAVALNSTSYRTNTAVATLIATKNFNDPSGNQYHWVVTSSNNKVTFTAEVAGLKTGTNTFTPSTSSVTGTLAILQNSLFDTTLGITLRGTLFNVPMNSGSQNTSALVATAIRAFSFSKWVTGGSGTLVTFTADREEARYGDLSITQNDTGITAVEEIKIDKLGEDSDINILFDKLVTYWDATLTEEQKAIMLNKERGELETGFIDPETNKNANNGALNYIASTKVAIANFKAIDDRFHQSILTSTTLSSAISTRVTYLPTRISQINNTMIYDAPYYYNSRASLIAQRLRKQSGTLVDVYRRFKGKRALAQQNRTTEESIAYWSGKMIVKAVEASGSGGRYIICEVSSDEATYHFNVGDTIWVVSDTINQKMIYKILSMQKIVVDSGVDEEGNAIKKTVNKIYIDKKLPSTLTLDGNPRLVKVTSYYS